MGAFGERLRREREMRGVSLEEIAAVTKIGTRLLRALEEENFDQLPGGIFNKSYVRAYCKCVGMDEEQGVADYLEASGETAPDVRVIARQNASARAERPISTDTGFPVIPVLVLLVAVVGAVAGWHVLQERRREQAQKQPASSSMAASNIAASSRSTHSDEPVSRKGVESSSEAKAVPSTRISTEATVRSTSQTEQPAKTQTSSSSALASPTGSPFEVSVKAKDRAWVSIQSDGKIMVRGIIKAPDVKTIRANNQVVLWTGNAGEVEVSFNGKNVPVSGGQNDERMLVFNAHGLLPDSAHQ